MWKAFPDLHLRYEVLAAVGDLIVGQIRFTGTSHGPYLGKPPTGKRFEAWGLSLIRMPKGSSWRNGPAWMNSAFACS